ncbi:hypothetical protein QS257_16325 [Terrilactibacillus sp. S3-3]|nr:hypothetical protein QS257_16325 [Terrilactibacillus sp. S3-3]
MKKRQIGLAKKLVLGMVGVAVITYSTSAFFIFILAPFMSDYIPNWLFDLLTLLLGVIWSGILGYFTARYLTRTLREISDKMARAAEGQLNIEIAQIHTRDEFEILNDKPPDYDQSVKKHCRRHSVAYRRNGQTNRRIE